MASLPPLHEAPSLLGRHTERVERPPAPEAEDEDPDDDPWVFAEPDESVDSFLEAYPPSSTNKMWISTSHEERENMIKAYYKALYGEEYMGGDKEQIAAAWEASEKKSLEVLTAILKDAKYGSGKWMIFSPASEVDALWARIVRALWDGKLGHTAKVSGANADPTKSHVICVYVDPFWEEDEVVRVLQALRQECGVNEGIKYKADGVTVLNLYKANDWGIPPSFYVAAKGALRINVQTADVRRWCKNGANCKHLKAGRCSYLHSEEDMKEAKVKDEPSWRVADADGMIAQRPSGRTTRAVPAPQAPSKPKTAAALGGFAALAGFDDGDSEAILEKKRQKAAKKAAKKAAEEAKVYADAMASFEALKASAGQASWGDEAEEEDAAAAAAAAEEEEEDDAAEESDSEPEPEAEVAGEEDEDGAGATMTLEATESARERRARRKEKKEGDEEAEVEELLAQLDAGKSEKEAGEGGVSKAAAKRAKKKAEEEARKKAETEAANAPAQVTAGKSVEDEGETDPGAGAAPKSAEEIREIMKARAEAAKKKTDSKKGSSSAAALAAAEAKKREAEAGKKKKEKKLYQSSGGKQVGVKARGSDNKYQGE